MSRRSRLPDAVLATLHAGEDRPEGHTGSGAPGAWSRRDFLKVSGAAGGGLLLAIQLPGSAVARESVGAAGEAAFAPNAYLDRKSVV